MSDVYSFGVVLLELLSGKRAVDKSRPSREQNLVEWARPLLKDFHKLDKIMDPKLDGQYSSEGARKAAALAYQCLSHHAKCRPTMDNVVKTLDNILDLKKDIPVGSFVYTVPREGEKVDDHSSFKTKGHLKNEEEKRNTTQRHEEKEEEDRGVAEWEKKGNNNGRQRGRNKHRIRPRAVYSDTALYTTLKKELKPLKAKDIRAVNPDNC